MKLLMTRLLAALFLMTATNAYCENSWFVDTNLVYERGSQLSKQYLSKNAPGFEAKSKELLPWLVRIEVQHSFEGNTNFVNHGTGVILKGGIVMTAKHVVTKNVKDPTKEIRINLTTIDGRVFTAKILKKGNKDWAALKMNLSDEQKEILNSPVKVAAPVIDETCVFLGYPARLGLDEKGKVQSFHKGDAKAGVAVSKLNPMVIVGAAADLKAMNLRPLAGFPPVGGMSGGPIFNIKGELVAVQHSVATTREDSTGKVVRYGIGATSSADISTLKPFIPVVKVKVK